MTTEQSHPEAPEASGTDPADDSAPAAVTAPTEDAPALQATTLTAAASDTPTAESTNASASEENPESASALKTEEAEGETEEESAESAEAEGESAEAEGDKPKKKRRRRKKKKPASEGGSQAHERAPFRLGEEVFGKVTAVMDTAVMVDLSGKALAIFDRGEMEPDDLVPEVGDRFVAQVLGDGGRGGLVLLTRKPLREEDAKPKVEAAQKDGTLLNALVTGVIKGGVEVVYEGLRGFVPASGVDLHPRTANLQTLVGQVLDFKVATYEKQGREVVFTRRPMLEKEAHERRKKAREVLVEGAEMLGVVRTVVEWGAFVALPEAENLEGLIHLSELSHNPRDRVADVLKPGQKLKVQIQKIDDKGKIWLSRKALVEDPFAALTENVAVGQEIEGEITRVEDFGAFVKIAEGFEGLLHAADLGSERVNDAREVLKAGEKLKVVVHHIDKRQRRIALHPALPEDRAGEERQRITKGNKVKVEVVKIDKPGLVVRVLGATGRQARGFIPAGQTGTQRGTELRKHFSLGEQIEVLVLDIDPRRHEPKFSISKLAQDEERRAHKEYRTKLKAEANFGTLGDLLKQKLGG